MDKLFTIAPEEGQRPALLLAPPGDLGIGGAGCHAAASSRSLRAKLVAAARDPAARPMIEEAVLALTPVLCVDTAEFEHILLPPAQPGSAPELLRRPDGYERLASPDGLELLAQVDTPVAAHMKDWKGLGWIGEKRANSEGEGIPVYGAANVLASAGLVWQWVRSLALRVAEAAGMAPAARLAEQGVEVRRDILILNVYAGLGGATGTGSAEVILAMFSAALDEIGVRGRAEIRLHLLGGSYHVAASEDERGAAVARAAGLLRRLRSYGSRRRTVSFGLPGGETLTIPPHLSYRFADTFFLHSALPGEPYPEFVRRVSIAVYHAEVGPRAARLRLARANAPARRNLFDDLRGKPRPDVAG